MTTDIHTWIPKIISCMRRNAILARLYRYLKPKLNLARVQTAVCEEMIKRIARRLMIRSRITGRLARPSQNLISNIENQIVIFPSPLKGILAGNICRNLPLQSSVVSSSSSDLKCMQARAHTDAMGSVQGDPSGR